MIPSYLVLSQQIKNELNNIQRVIDRILKVWSQIQENPADQDLYIESVALNLQSFYTGVERIFQLIVARFEEELPSGKHWHTDLLTQVSMDLPDLRPPVIKQSTQNLLDDYRSFRHRIRNIYTYHIDPEKVEVLVTRLPEVYTVVQKDIDQFLDFIDSVAQATVDDED
jgi:hypothetical protein